MSTNVRKIGFSYALNDVPISKLKEICKHLNQDYDEYDEDEFYPNFDYDKHLNRWIIQSDFNGVYGLVKVVDYEYDSFNLEHSISLAVLFQESVDFNNIMGSVGLAYIDYDINKFKVFSMLYYNGSDEPFIF